MISRVNPFPSRFVNRTIFICHGLGLHGCACCLLFDMLLRKVNITASNTHFWFLQGSNRVHLGTRRIRMIKQARTQRIRKIKSNTTIWISWQSQIPTSFAFRFGWFPSASFLSLGFPFFFLPPWDWDSTPAYLDFSNTSWQGHRDNGHQKYKDRLF